MRTRKWKEREVENLKSLVSKYRVIGIAGFRGVPAQHFKIIKESIRGDALIRVSKNNLIKLALDGRDELKKYVYDQTALIFTNSDPFKIYRKLQQSKVKAPIRGGAVAPCDIVVPAGDTPFRPGPVVADLQSVGIPASIEKGKVVVRKETVVARKGEKVSPKLADLLAKMEIHPVDLGLDVRVIWDNGLLLTPDLLGISAEDVKSWISRAMENGFKLAFNVNYPTKQVISALLVKAFSNAYTLAMQAEIYERDTIGDIIKKAYLSALSIKNLTGNG